MRCCLLRRRLTTINGGTRRWFAGHSKWANIKHRKGRRDADRQDQNQKILKEVQASAAGGVGEDNFRLQAALAKARAASVPSLKIDAAIVRGSAPVAKGGANIESVLYEGHGPGGAALLVETITDNRHRTAPSLRYIFNKNGGSLGNSGSVAWVYEERVEIEVPQDVQIDELLDVAVEAGADDVVESGAAVEAAIASGECAGDDDTSSADGAGTSSGVGHHHVVVCEPEHFPSVRSAITAASIEMRVRGLQRQPKSFVDLNAEKMAQFEDLLAALVDDDDVQVIYHNVAEEGLEHRIVA